MITIAGVALLIVALKDAIARLFFMIESFLAQFLDLLYEIFMVFAGITPIYDGNRQTYLLDFFVQNDVISALYWGMAMIGIAMTFGFGIWAIVKKFFDSTGEKMKTTNGQILTNIFKSILIILLMTAIVSATVDATGTLMQTLNDLFNNAYELSDPSEISFDDEDYATMFRIIDTIDNYSLNPSYNNRININSCFNAIRGDLYVLARNGIFNFSYDKAGDMEAISSWQYYLRQIYLAADVTQDLNLEDFNSAVTSSINAVVERIHTDNSFIPLSYYYRGYSNKIDGTESVLGRTCMLSGSFSAAKNSKYNESPDIMDSLRRPYYTGSKDIFSIGVAENDFDVSFESWNHIVVIIEEAILIFEFLKILINCVARVFNIILLYVTAPGFVSVMPLDDGGKFKQWCTAFIIQSLSIFGTFIAVRLLMIFIPLILKGELVLFASGAKNMTAKIVMIIGICFTAQKAGGLISGILADNAGYQSLLAGDVGSGAVSSGLAIGGKVLGAAAKVGKGVLGAAANELGINTGLKMAGEKIGNVNESMRDKGGLIGAAKSGFTTDKQDAQKKADAKQDAKDRMETQFRNKVTGALDKLTGGGLGNLGGDNSNGNTKDNNSTQDPPPSQNPLESKGSNSVKPGIAPAAQGLNKNNNSTFGTNGINGTNPVSNGTNGTNGTTTATNGTNGTNNANKDNEIKETTQRVAPPQQPKEPVQEMVPPPVNNTEKEESSPVHATNLGSNGMQNTQPSGLSQSSVPPQSSSFGNVNSSPVQAPNYGTNATQGTQPSDSFQGVVPPQQPSGPAPGVVPPQSNSFGNVNSSPVHATNLGSNGTQNTQPSSPSQSSVSPQQSSNPSQSSIPPQQPSGPDPGVVPPQSNNFGNVNTSQIHEPNLGKNPLGH